MWHLSRVHLRGVGHPDARFDPLELDLTYDGDPCDTVWWLENGGGKTSLLSLVFAVLRPRTSEFLGASHKRGLADYVGSGDVAHVVLEWKLPSAGLPGIGEDDTLLTGLTLEWPDLRAQPGNNSGLNRMQWGFRPTGAFGLGQLPFLDERGRPRRARAFAEQLARELAGSPAAQLHRPDANQSSWHEWLTNQDLDPEVFRFQLAMNQDEGAIAEEFSFTSGDDFVRWALNVAADPELPAKVAKTLDAVSGRIHQRPQLEMELELCEGAAHRLQTLADAHAQLQTAETTVGHALGAAAELARGVDLAVSQAEDVRQAAEADKQTAEQAANRANNDATRAGRLSNRWRQLAASATERDARSACEQATDAVAAAELDVIGWQVAELLDQQDRTRRERDGVREQLDRFEEGLAPLKAQIATAEVELVARAAHLSARIGADLGEVERQQQELRAEAATDTEQLTHLDGVIRRAQREVSNAEARLATSEKARTQAVDDGLLASDDVPGEAADAASLAADRAAEDLAVGRARRDAADEAVQQADERVSTLRDALADAKMREEAAGGRLAEMDTAAADLARHELLIEATQLTPAEVWAQAPVTLDRLRQMADEARRDQIDASLHASEIDRIVNALEVDGYAPPSPDVAAALGVLRDVGIPAVAGYTYLTQAVAAEERPTILAAAPDVAAGVVLTDPDPDLLGRAEAALGGLVPSAPLTVATAAVFTDPAPAAQRVVLPPDPAVYDASAAEVLLDRLTGERDSTRSAFDHARRRVAEIENVAVRFEQLHDRWPDPEEVRRLVASSTSEVTKAARELEDARAAQRTAAAERSTARAALGPLEDQLRAARERWQRLNELAEQWAERDGLERQARDEKRTLDDAEGARTQLRERGSERVGQLEQLATSAQQLTGRRGEVADQLTRLALSPIDVARAEDPGGTLTEHERNLTQLRHNLTAQRTELGLADKLQNLDDQLATIAAALADRDEREIVRGRELLDGPSGQTPAARREAAGEAANRRSNCTLKAGAAEAAVNAAVEAVEKAAALDTVELPEGTVIPDGAAELAAQAAAETDRSNDLWRQRRHHNAGFEQAKRRATDAANRKALLQQTALHLTDALGNAPAAAEALEVFAGTPAEADGAARRVLAAIKEAESARAEATTKRQAAHHAVVQFVRRDTFTSLVGDGDPTSKVVARLTIDEVDALAADAQTVQGDLVRRAAGIRQDLIDVDAHRQLLIDQLVGVARDAIGLLDDIQARSLMPDGLAGWSKRRFIEIRHAPLPDDPAALGDRIARTVDQLVASKSTPGGDELLYRTTRAAVGDEPFDVRIIKPHMDLRYDRVNVTSLTGFSGGQKVTAAVALFTTMLNMRATARGKHGYRTTLLLDNPFGKSSADAFVHLQRQVAQRLGIQLVFTTAVKDLAALSQFRRVIRLEHRRNRISGALHVVGRTESSQLVAAAVSRGDEPALADGEPAA